MMLQDWQRFRKLHRRAGAAIAFNALININFIQSQRTSYSDRMPHTRLRAIRGDNHHFTQFAHGIHKGLDARGGNAVVIYNNLSPRDESRLFIDINTKQRPVPNELLLDIKKLAEYETEVENLLGEVFDRFNSDPASPLLGLLSPHERTSNKISRVTFNAGLKQLLGTFGGTDVDGIYDALSSYVTAFIAGAKQIKATDVITKPTVFRAVMALFPEVAQRVKDKYGKSYTTEHFAEALEPMFGQIKPSLLNRPSNSHRELHAELSSGLKTSFTL